MFISIWNAKKEKYNHLNAVDHIYNDTIVAVGNVVKPAFAIEIKGKKTYYDKEYYTLDFIHKE